MSNGKIKTLTINTDTELTVYAVVNRVSDGFLLDTTSGFFANGNGHYGLSLPEIDTGIYSVDESRSQWTNGLYNVQYYSQLGSSPDILTDTLLLNNNIVLNNDIINPAISGDTLDSNIVSSSLTSLGVIDSLEAVDADVSGNFTAVDADFSGNVIAVGLDLSGDFAIATNKFTVAAATGNTLIAGTVGITGKLTTGVGSTAGAKFNLPTSSADPTSPVEGDVWKLATALRCYVNGVLGTITIVPDV